MLGRPKSTKIKTGEVYQSNGYGDFVITEVRNAKEIDCEFISTGYKITKQAEHIRSGTVKDPFYPSILGVGFFGSSDKNAGNQAAYQKWRNMLARCYDSEYQSKYQTYVGCSVCDEWHNFQNFKAWYEQNLNDSIINPHLDKDGLIDGNKVYSPDTCQLITPKENQELAHCRKVKIKSPNGEIVEVLNVSEFCRENNLSQAHLSSVINGKRNTHKGWTRA